MSFSSWVPHIPDITHGKGIGIGTAVALGCLSVLVLLILFFVIRAVCRRRRMYAYMKKQEQYSSLLNAPLLDEYEIERANLMQEFQVRDDVENEYDGTMNLLVKSEVAKTIYEHKKDSFGDFEMGNPSRNADSVLQNRGTSEGDRPDRTLLEKLKDLALEGQLRLHPKDTKLAVRIPFATHYRPFVWRYVLDAMNATLERRRRRSAPSKFGELPAEMMDVINVDVPRCRLCPVDQREDLKMLLKSWLLMMPDGGEYRQGADTIAAIIMSVFPHDVSGEAASVLLHVTRNFIPEYFTTHRVNKYLHQRLGLFSSLLRFWDPAMATFLRQNDLVPSMFAVPWFVTLFGDIWPLEKVIYIWDALFFLGPDFLVFVGISVLCHSTNRAKLLRSNFSNAMQFFSRLNRGEEVLNLRLCIFKAISMFSQTPGSVLHYTEEKTTDIAREQLRGRTKAPSRRYCPGSTAREWSSTEFASVDDMNTLVLVVSWPDVFEMEESSCVLCDLRNCSPEEHTWLAHHRAYGKPCIHVPHILEDLNDEQVVLLLSKIKQYIGRYIVLCIWDTAECSELVEILARAGVPRVCCLLLNRQTIPSQPLMI
mgnify:FL=1|jgi:hypothetical protein